MNFHEHLLNVIAQLANGLGQTQWGKTQSAYMCHAGAGLKPPMGVDTPGRAPGYLQLWLLPLRIRPSILQLLQALLALIPGLAPLPQLVQQHVTHLHLLMDFGLDLLYDHLMGMRPFSRLDAAGEGGAALKAPPKVGLGTLQLQWGHRLQDAVTGLTGWRLGELCSGGWLE